MTEEAQPDAVMDAAAMTREQAEAAWRNGNHETALRAFHHILRRYPEDAAAHHRMGNLLRAMGRNPDPCYARALALAPANPVLLRQLGNIARERGRLPRAEARHRWAVTVDPRNLEALQQLALTRRTAGDIGATERVLRVFAALAPGESGVWRQFAELRAGNPFHPSLETALRRQSTVATDAAAAHHNLAVLRSLEGLPILFREG